MLSTQDIVRLLVVDASFEGVERVTNMLRHLGLAVRVLRVEEEETLRTALNSKAWELVICAAVLPGLSITQVLRLLQQSEKDIPLIAVVEKETAPDTIDKIYSAGARDVVPRDHPLRLQCVAKRELEDLQNRRAYRRSERRVAESERRARTLLDSSRDAVAYVGEGMHLYANQAYLRLFGCNGLDELESIPLLDMAAPEERNRFKAFLKEYSQGEGEYAQFSFKVRQVDGNAFVVTMEFTPTSIEGELCTQIIIRDKAYDPALEEKIEQLQQRDRMSGLFNRHYFFELMEAAVSVARAGGEEGNLFYVALDSFYQARERFGLEAGDMVVGEVAQTLRRHCNEGARLARFGDEAFTLIVTQVSQDQVDALAERLRQAVEEHLVEVGRYTINVTCSIGICRIGESAPGVQPVLERAYKACLKAQAEGGNRVEHYSPVAADLTHQEKVEQWEKRLRWALGNDSFRLLYQPVVSLHGKMEELFDVLLRLIDESGVYISLEEFLEPATQLGLMGRIDRWIIGEATQVLQVQHQKGHATRFFTKLSDSSIQDASLISWLEELLQATQLQANSLIFEISENAALNYLKRARALIQGGRALGCRFALEHFGAGLDTANYLKHLDVDYIKISGAFMENLLQDKHNHTTVKAIIKMAQKAGKLTIAESVSDANTLALLWQLGVDYAQGHYVQEPSEILSYDFTGDV